MKDIHEIMDKQLLSSHQGWRCLPKPMSATTKGATGVTAPRMVLSQLVGTDASNIPLSTEPRIPNSVNLETR